MVPPERYELSEIWKKKTFIFRTISRKLLASLRGGKFRRGHLRAHYSHCKQQEKGEGETTEVKRRSPERPSFVLIPTSTSRRQRAESTHHATLFSDFKREAGINLALPFLFENCRSRKGSPQHLASIGDRLDQDKFLLFFNWYFFICVW